MRELIEEIEKNVERFIKEKKENKENKEFSISFYSNLGLAFYKLHGLGFLEQKEGKEIKQPFLESLLSLIDESALKDAVSKVQKLRNRLESGFFCESLTATVGYCFVTGMGYPSFVENGMLFHHTYGIPYIHGEAVKGLVRYVFLEKKLKSDDLEKLSKIAEKLEEEEYKGNPNLQEEYAQLFGTKKREGKLMFFDAYPVELKKENFKIDVMNPHYGKYYETKGEKPPADWYNPVPIFFLTLQGAEFEFTIGFDRLRVKEKEGEELLKKAKDLLKEGLELYGLGGKRRKGYGWFEVYISNR